MWPSLMSAAPSCPERALADRRNTDKSELLQPIKRYGFAMVRASLNTTKTATSDKLATRDGELRLSIATRRAFGAKILSGGNNNDNNNNNDSNSGKPIMISHDASLARKRLELSRLGVRPLLEIVLAATVERYNSLH